MPPQPSSRPQPAEQLRVQHAPAKQSWPHVTGLGVTQFPPPLQNDAGWNVADDAQLAGAHCVVDGGTWHCVWLNAGLQLPPQVVPPFTQPGRAPCGCPLTAVHVPAEPATSQAWHWPEQLALQHTPSTQMPELHWFAALQPPPSAFLALQTPAEQ